MRTLIMLILFFSISFTQTPQVKTSQGWKKLGLSSYSGDSINLPSGGGTPLDTNALHYTKFSAKQNTLVSGTNIKTINGNTLLGSGDMVISGGSDPFLVKLRLASDVTNATTTPATLTGMSFSYVANSFYIIDMYMLASSAATTTGYGFALDVSTAVTSIGIHFTHVLANTGTLTGGSCLADNTATGVSSGVPAISVSNPVMGHGILITGANAGTATFMFRPEVAASATCKAGSIITVMKIN